MWEPSTAAEKKFSEETHRIIAEEQLHKFVSFLNKFSDETYSLKGSLKNIHHVTQQFISVDEEMVTNIPMSYLVHSDNKNLTRILESLGGVCKEMLLLVEEADLLYEKFVMYEKLNESSFKLEAVGKIIKPLQSVHCFVDRVREVVILTLKQLCRILGKKYLPNNSTLFPEVLNCLGDILICLMKFDNLLDLQILKDHWFLYRKTIKNIAHSNKHNVDKNQLNKFDKTLIMLENDLLMSIILKTTIEKCLEDKELSFQLKKCNLNNEFYTFINFLLADLEKSEENSYNVQSWFKMNIFVVLYFNIFGNLDKRAVKRLLEINKRISAYLLIGNTMWYPDQFLLKHIHSFNSYIDEKNIENHRIHLIQSRNSYLPKEVNFITLQGCFLLIEFSKLVQLNVYNFRLKRLQEIINLLTEVLKLLKKINYIIQWTLNIHVDKNVPITKSVLVSICRLIELLKCFKIIYNKCTITITYMLLILIQQLSYKALCLLNNVKKQHTQDKSYKEHQLDVLSALNICEHVLKKPITKDTILVAHLSLSASGLSISNLSEIRNILNQLEVFCSFCKNLTNATNLNFLYWHYTYIVPIYFSKLLTSKIEISRHELLLKALTDMPLIDQDDIIKVTNNLISEHFYKPLEQLIEVNLRLQTHLHLQLPKTDPFEKYFALNFLKYHPVPIFKYYKNVKREMEHHLSTAFYNFTSVALNDWKTYGEMRTLASLQYDLNTIDDHLPIQTLGQSLDVLEIMRNINIFVSQYMYNLNSQVFIERESKNKHLNSIHISHVANSIRAHGIGIMNTTVNFTYQFLRTKFYIFSQFLFDELIKSRLIKDIKYFNENKKSLNQMYPYERAEKFNSGIKRMGLNDKGESYLDLFRKVITQIGNAMGYVRLIRSGGRRCLAEGTSFIPDLEKIKDLQDCFTAEEIPDLSKQGSQGLLNHLQSFVANIDEATEYFELLVKVFVPVLRNKENIHLKNFHMIIPPLTVNYVEYSLNFKDKLNKRNKLEYCFTDDGFVLGLAYIIEILNQEKLLDSLHWFQSVERKLKNDKLRIKEQAAVDNDSKLKQTLSLSEKKVAIYEKEFQYLFYNFNSARLFFQL